MTRTRNLHFRLACTLAVLLSGAAATPAATTSPVDDPPTATAVTISRPASRPVPQPSTRRLASTRSRTPAAYGWPVRPFHTQHPVRGAFGDPRIGMSATGMTHTFHFGIDVSCPNGTAVYATIDGTARLESFRPETVAVVHDDGRREHQYWHVAPNVVDGQRVRAYETVVGHVLEPWAHVHFAEVLDGRYVNPLRQGALGPYSDTTRPELGRVTLERDGRPIPGRVVDGRVDVVVEAWDTTPLAIPAPWDGKPLTPARLRWRLLRAGEVIRSWTPAVDFRTVIPSNDRYSAVYARWTRQNKAARQGRYRFFVERDLDAERLGAGSYVIEIEGSDTRGNRTTSTEVLIVPSRGGAAR